MRAASDRRSHLKQTWLRIVQAGAGSLVVAAAMIGAPSAQAAVPAAKASIEERVQHAREALLPVVGQGDRKKDAPDRLAFWGNRFGVVARPMWPNWPNWNNWHNWPNWPNY